MCNIRAGWAGLLLLISGSLSAGVIYDNGGPNGVSGNEATAWIQAEDFMFAVDTTVTDVHVYFGTFNDFSAWDGTADYSIYSDTAGSPTAGAGGVLASGSGQNVSTSDSGIPWGFGGNAFELSFDLLSPFNALAGTSYWLGIHLASDFTPDSVFWVTTAANGTSSGYESSGGTLNNWQNNGQEHAFYLTGDAAQVPSPATLALFGIGLAGLSWSKRKKA